MLFLATVTVCNFAFLMKYVGFRGKVVYELPCLGHPPIGHQLVGPVDEVIVRAYLV